MSLETIGTPLESQPAGITPEPIVHLENAFQNPFNNAIATARTCYSSRVITASDVDKDARAIELRDKIAESTYEAGHHTTLQHATFQFVLERVSRQFIWSFLHSHPFYNSEQVSQRYVEVKPGNYLIPPLVGVARDLYVAAATRMTDAYHRLIDVLSPDVEREFFKLFPARAKKAHDWRGAIKKKAQEIARYILPVATHAHLYHTVSGLTLHRYNRLSQMFDVPTETRFVVAKMIAEVNRVDPLFFRHIEDPLPLEATTEHAALAAAGRLVAGDSGARAFRDEFDADLGRLTSKLVDYKINAEAVLADGVRSSLGIPRDAMSDDAAIALALAPEHNRLFAESLNLVYHAKLTRALAHPHYTFAKRLSHTADSQDQRHRMTPASRPVLFTQFVPGEPDVVLPELIAANAEAHAIYDAVLRDIWHAIESLLADGVDHEFALYLLPNAFPVRFVESGDAMALHHKWTARLCFAAQEEIWRASLDEVEQVRRVHPRIGNQMMPPCQLRQRAGVRPYCPEGPRYCGVPVWNLTFPEFSRVL